jgi:hypothetical protein
MTMSPNSSAAAPRALEPDQLEDRQERHDHPAAAAGPEQGREQDVQDCSSTPEIVAMRSSKGGLRLDLEVGSVGEPDQERPVGLGRSWATLRAAGTRHWRLAPSA